MTDEPDYSRYSIPDLLRARNFMDAERYPDQAARLDAELARRGPLPRYSIPRAPQRRGKWLVYDATNRGVGIYMMISGVLSLAPILETPEIWPESTLTFLMFSVPFLSYSLMILAGFLLYRRHRFAMFLAITALLPQTLVFQVQRLTYVVLSVPIVEIKLWPVLDLTFSTSSYFALTWHDSPTGLFLGLSVCPLIVMGILSERIDKMWAALERLRSKGDAQGQGVPGSGR